MDRHARSPPPVFRRVWRENAPLSRLSRLSPSTAGHESRGGGPKTPLLLPPLLPIVGLFCPVSPGRAMRYLWVSFGGPVPKPPLYRPLPPDPPLPYLAMGIQFSRSPSPWAATTFLEISLSRDESSSFIYIYSIDEEFVNREREIERVAWSISELIYSSSLRLISIHVLLGRGGRGGCGSGRMVARGHR